MGKRLEFKFGIRETPKGAVAWMVTPKLRELKKQFRNGHCPARVAAQRWIDDEIATIREHEEIENLKPTQITQTHKQHGGARVAGEGKRIGRPPKPDAKIRSSISMPPDIERYFRSLESGTRNAAIESMIRNSRQFKAWKRQNETS